MAEANPPNQDDVYSVLELFSGRFTTEEMRVLMEHNNNDPRVTASFILFSEPEEITRLLEENVDNWTEVQHRRNRSLTERIRARAKAGKFDTEVREFSCAQCDSFWWRRVPTRKMVSQCFRCRQKYKPVPVEREWGIAEFFCHGCNKTFRGWGQMNQTLCPCYDCGTAVPPRKIFPPSNGTRTSRTGHMCLAPDCYNRNRIRDGPYWVVPPGVDPERVTCVHPQSRRRNGRPMVVEISNEHISTGSTVATFLDQGNLRATYEEVVFSPALPTIGED